MKRVITFLSVILTLAILVPVQAQDKENPRKLRKEADRVEKVAIKDIKSRSVKEARKEAKRLKKQGYTVFPGALPLDKQLEKIWIKQYEESPNGAAKYLVADGNGVGKTQTASEMQAMEAAKLQLAGQISNEINQIIESKIVNDQLDRETGNSLSKFVAGGKNYIVQNLTYVRPGFKVYRNMGKRDMEVFVKVYYNAEEAFAAAEKALEAKARADLEEEADVLIDEINRLLDR
ncbi:MAG: hypothetical protein MRZ79_12105 [Bacteroidia bacterium]|nr:hypothetical protein [Bacteroidia bacterium]